MIYILDACVLRELLNHLNSRNMLYFSVES